MTDTDIIIRKRIRERTGATMQAVDRLWNVLRDEDEVIKVLQSQAYENTSLEVFILNYKLEKALERISRLENERFY